MTENIFRPVEFWKSAIMTMPDNSFFELVRSVFGKIKTPFNKQQLVNDLEAFLLREDIRKAVSCYIDGNDAKIIAAVALLDEPAPGELESFFSGELSYAELHDIVVNLEERFILYRFMEETVYGNRTTSWLGRLALNPVLETALKPFALDNSPLLPSVPAGDAEETNTSALPEVRALNDPVLAGFLSFVSVEKPLFRSEGEIRRRSVEAAKTIFPGIDLESVLGSLQALGLLYVDGDRMLADYGYFSDFAALTPRERIEYCAAGIMCYRETESPFGILPPLVRSKIRSLAIFIHRFLDSLEKLNLFQPRRCYPEKTLKRLTEILQREKIDRLLRINTCASGTCGGELLNINNLFEALEKTGLLIPVSGGLWRLGSVVKKQVKDEDSPARETSLQDANGPVIAADSDFSFQIYPEISYKDAIDLASFLNICKAGMTIRFEMTRESAVRAFDRNISADRITELLNRLSGNRISETLVWTLKEWEKRYGEVSLRRGLILSLSEDRRYLAQTESLAGLISETVAPGLYLLYDDAQNEAAKALAAAGVDIVARNSGSLSKTTDKLSQNIFSSLRSENRVSLAAVSGQAIKENDKAAALIGEFSDKLKKMTLSKPEKDELAARINRRLVLCEAQLADADVRYEKLEARLLDYNGKINIAKQAVAQQSPVELHLPGREKEERLFGIAKAVEKSGNEFFLLISTDGEQETMRVPIGKLSLLRRIKKSIFENKE